MLGVTRPSVTLIAGYLRRTGVIDYARDEIVLLDRGRSNAPHASAITSSVVPIMAVRFENRIARRYK